MADIKVGMVFDVPKTRESARTAAVAAQEVVKETMKKATEGQRNIFGGFRPGMGGVPANMWFARNPGMLPSQVQAAAGGAAGGGGGGLIGSLMGGLGAFGKSLLKVVSIIEIFRRTIQAINNAMDEGRRRYTKQLQTGMPGGFTTMRSALADTLGVSEYEILHYGKAVAWMTDRVRLSARELDRTTKTLATAAVNWRVLGLNMRAWWANVTATMAPALNMMSKALSAWIEFIRESGTSSKIMSVFVTLLQLLTAALSAAVLPLMAVVTALTALADSIQYLFQIVNNARAKVSGQKIDESDPFKETKGAFGAMMKMIQSFSRGSANEKLPNATTDYRKLDSSPWERMGLVIGGGMAANPIKNIERHTKRTADLLQRMLPRNDRPLVKNPATLPNAL